MVVIGVIQGIFAIVSSGLACHGLCGGDDSQYVSLKLSFTKENKQSNAFS